MRLLICATILTFSASSFACVDFSGEYIAPYDTNVTLTVNQNSCREISFTGTDGYNDTFSLIGIEKVEDLRPAADIVSTETCQIKSNQILCVGYQVSGGVRDTLSRAYTLLDNGDISVRQSAGTLKSIDTLKRKD